MVLYVVRACSLWAHRTLDALGAGTSATIPLAARRVSVGTALTIQEILPKEIETNTTQNRNDMLQAKARIPSGPNSTEDDEILPDHPDFVATETLVGLKRKEALKLLD